jgi:hypothetical protein
MSPRNFSRLFRGETGETPAQFTERARAASARCKLEHTVVPGRDHRRRSAASVMPNPCGAHFSAFSRSVRTTTRRGFDQPSSTDTAIERGAAHPLKRGRGGNIFVTINSGDALLLSRRPRLQAEEYRFRLMPTGRK